MVTLGLLGGVASGKSFVAGEFERLGAAVLDGDRAGHEVLRQAEVIAALTRRWGDQILDPSGQVDRQAVGKIVFAPSPEGMQELDFLEQVTHPRIAALLARKLDDLRRGGSTPLVVLDAALLLKAGWDRYCDQIAFVDVPQDERQRRAAARGWDRDELRRREAAQGTLEAKRQRADLVIDNAGDRDRTRRQVEQIWRKLTKTT